MSVIQETSPLLQVEHDDNYKSPEISFKDPDYSSKDAEFSYKQGKLSSGNSRQFSSEKETIPKFDIHIYKRRWYIIGVFAMICFLQNYLCNCWAVIAVSVKPAFDWSNAQISLMLCWYCFMYLLFIFPFSWLAEARGLRVPVILTAASLFIGTGLRCIVMDPPNVTWINQIACCFIGIAEPIVYSGGPVVSALWFPPNERATVTSIPYAVGYLGYGICFIFGPLLVSTPKPVDFTHIDGNNTSHEMYSNIPEIRSQIRMVRLIECAVCFVTMVSVIIYFPNKPPKPPSPSSALPKLSFWNGVKKLVRTAGIDFWFVGLAFAISSAIYSTWVSLLCVNFEGFLPQATIGYLGCIANVVGTIAGVIAGRLADVFVGRMKLIITLFVCAGIWSTYWVLLLGMQYIPFSAAQMYTSIIIQGIAIAGPIGLFFEMNIETNYPIHEIVTAGTMELLYNCFPSIMLFVFFIPNIGVSWMNWFMYGSMLLCFPLMLASTEHYKRLAVDRRQYHQVTSHNN